jgi:hypothetical protein
MPRSSEWSLSLDFPTKTIYKFLNFPIYVTCFTHLILLYLIGEIGCESLNWIQGGQNFN